MLGSFAARLKVVPFPIVGGAKPFSANSYSGFIPMS
jgi:hypothetical protein